MLDTHALRINERISFLCILWFVRQFVFVLCQKFATLATFLQKTDQTNLSTVSFQDLDHYTTRIPRVTFWQFISM